MGREGGKKKRKGEAMGRREAVASPLRGKRPWFHAWRVPGYTLNFHFVDGLLSTTAATWNALCTWYVTIRNAL